MYFSKKKITFERTPESAIELMPPVCEVNGKELPMVKAGVSPAGGIYHASGFCGEDQQPLL